MLAKVWTKGNLYTSLVGKLVQSLLKSAHRFLKNLEIDLPYDPDIVP